MFRDTQSTAWGRQDDVNEIVRLFHLVRRVAGSDDAHCCGGKQVQGNFCKIIEVNCTMWLLSAGSDGQ